jgi:hypothetical protein
MIECKPLASPKQARKTARPRSVPRWEQTAKIFVSMSAQAFYCAVGAKAAAIGGRGHPVCGLRAKDRLVGSWGTGVLAVEDNKKAASQSDEPARTSQRGTSKSGSRQRAGATRDGTVGNALRSVYQQTVNEDVPPEFLDLLGKLT